MNECDYNEEFEPRDFMDAFLKEKANRERNGEETSERFSVPELQAVCLDLWVNGQVTVSAALQWIFAYLIVYPEAQRKIHEEIDNLPNKDVVVTRDKLNLPYTNAVIMEVMRCANLLTINIPRATTEEVDLERYKLPKGTLVVPQMSTLFVNEKVRKTTKNFF